MKVLRVIFLILAVIGGFIIFDASNKDLEKEWYPLVCPYPGSGFKITDSFTVTKETQYWLEVEVPDHLSFGVHLPEKLPMDCILHVKITSNTVNYEDTVKQFQYEGQVPAQLVSLYVSDKEWNLKRGNYDVEISSEKTPNLISTNGAILKLEQIVNPVGPIILNNLQWWGGLLLLILGIAGLISGLRKK